LIPHLTGAGKRRKARRKSPWNASCGH